MEGDRVRECRQVVRADLRRCFEARGELDQDRLAEGCPEKAYSKRNTEDHSRRHLNNGISWRSGEAGGPEKEPAIIAIEQVSGPRRVISGRHYRVEVELADGGVNAV